MHAPGFINLTFAEVVGFEVVVSGMLGHVDLWGLNSEPANIPSLLAILLCDQIIIEQGSGKKTLVGVFEEMWSAGEPIAHPVGFFARITDLEGIYLFVIKVVRIAADGEIVVAVVNAQWEQTITDRLANLDLALNLPVVFPKFGKYEFQFFANEIYIGRAVLNVSKQEAQGQ